MQFYYSLKQPLKKSVASKKKGLNRFLMNSGDLIKTKHNSNHKTQQTTLEGEILPEYVYYVLGFVPVDVVRLKKDVWFTKLCTEQITSVEKFLDPNNQFNG